MYNRKAIFFDRDGVINKLVARDNGFFSPRTFDEFHFYEDVSICINLLAKKGFLIFIISNQPDISRKKMLIQELDKIDTEINKKLHIDKIYYSFDSKAIIGGSKKPSPKMVFEAQDKWNIDLSKSYFLGDSLVDIECAKNANVSFILVKREHNQDLEHPYCVDNLNDALKMISKII
tara:strand:- start:1027 stop:1554 length:528 start_codon:yes stop_codon:yes gene_type:complete